VVVLILQVQGGQPRTVEFPVRRIVNGGYTGRDQESVRRHIEELEAEGIAPPPETPMYLPVVRENVTMAEEIEVVGGETSGEAEYVLAITGAGVFVGVGSDHTDRALERLDMLASKQVCPNVMSPEVWPLEDVLKHWDILSLRSWLDRERRRSHQEAFLSELMEPERLMDQVRGRVGPDLAGTLIFSGTVSSESGGPGYSDYFAVELADRRTGRAISCGYAVKPIRWHLAYS